MIAPAAPTRLPPLAAPPHDPRWLRLDARVGWREAILDAVEADCRGRGLHLAAHPGRRRALTEPSGSFGGLVPPANVAIAADGSIYLLDCGSSGALKRFDACMCVFETVPCFGATATGARRLDSPCAIAVWGSDLIVCDAGAPGAQREPGGRAARATTDAGGPPAGRRIPNGGRVTFWALPELPLRAVWTLPADPPVRPLPWLPVGVAVDRRGRIWIADAANGMLLRFDRGGRLGASIGGLGGIRHVAIDSRDRIYAVLEGREAVQILAPDDTLLESTTADARTLRPFFPPLPFGVAEDGRLDLRESCIRAGAELQGASTGYFELSGNPAAAPQPASEPSFLADGMYLSGPLDSEIFRCSWHRLVVSGEVPAGTSVQIATYSAATPQPASHVRDLTETAWSALPAVSIRDGNWDGLIRSEPGRYLWLRIRFGGNGMASPRLRALRIEFPRISLRRYLPAVWGEEPVAADFADRFLAIFDTTLRSIEHQLDTQAELYDPLSAPAVRDPRTGTDFLSWLASWIGVVLDRLAPERQRREYLARAARGFDLRGTRIGLHRQLLFFLGMQPEDICCRDHQPRDRCSRRPVGCARAERPPCAWEPPPLILEHYQLRRWLFLGASRLGDQAVLWGQRIVNRSRLSREGGEDRAAQVGVTQLITTPDPLRDPFHVYAHRFSVFVPASLRASPQRRRALENLIASEKPAHTAAQVVYVEPRFRIGFQSMIGLDSVVGRYPEGVPLGATPLGIDSVLSGGRQGGGGPTLRLGAGQQVGITAVLD